MRMGMMRRMLMRMLVMMVLLGISSELIVFADTMIDMVCR